MQKLVAQGDCVINSPFDLAGKETLVRGAWHYAGSCSAGQ
jgi:hypothetical protein